MTEKSLGQKYRELSEAYAHAIMSLIVLEKAGLYHKLQEQLQLAIGNLPKEAVKQNPAAEYPPPNENKGG